MCSLAHKDARVTARRGSFFTWAAMAAAAIFCSAAPGLGQSVVSVVQQRPFVTSFRPVIGPGGGVGGVSIDAQGIVARSDVESLGRLRDARLRALEKADAGLQTTSRLRKISLRGMLAEIERRRKAGLPAGDELANLAGLVRIQLVLVYPERGDLVLAGPAEAWKVDGQGNLVGQTSGQPVLQLDDLVVALRTAKNAASEEGITCSINPTPEGLKQLQRVLKTPGLAASEAAVARLEESLGPQRITVTGVPPESHFAQVLLAADFMMKRLAMKLEPTPITGMPSYMDMLQNTSATLSRTAMPRFWMAPRYEPLLKDAEGLVFELRGGGVQAMTEEGFLGRDGAVVSGRGKEDLLARKWAETMTAKYEELSVALPIFAELRNCIDLAVVAALLLKEDLPGIAGCDLSLLMDDAKIQVALYQAPKTVASRASLVRKGQQWIVSISGGVQVDSWSVVNRVEQRPELAKVREAAALVADERWWWD
jgi:hypothetical protein